MAFPCSAFFNNDLLPGIILTCNSAILKYFKISLATSPSANINYRMLNNDLKTYLIEIVLYFETGKIMKINLDPSDPSVLKLFNLLIVKKYISFHFHNIETGFTASAYIEIDDRQMEWVIRNYKLMKTLPPDNDEYFLVAYSHSSLKNKNETTFFFDPVIDSKYLFI